MNSKHSKSAAVVVAHPDDETLWAGGTILSEPSWRWFIACLCRGSDEERAPRFYRALKVLNAKGIMGDLDDGPEQNPLGTTEVERAVLDLLPLDHFDLIISHNPTGEYTRHRRHEEVSRAVIELWHAGNISASELWTFAYEDGNRAYHPRPVENAPVYRTLPQLILRKKYSIIMEIYGFEAGSFEADTTPRSESFWRFADPDDAAQWLAAGGVVVPDASGGGQRS